MIGTDDKICIYGHGLNGRKQEEEELQDYTAQRIFEDWGIIFL